MVAFQMGIIAGQRDRIRELTAENGLMREALDVMLAACDKGSHDSYEIYRACERAYALVGHPLTAHEQKLGTDNAGRDWAASFGQEQESSK